MCKPIAHLMTNKKWISPLIAGPFAVQVLTLFSNNPLSHFRIEVSVKYCNYRIFRQIRDRCLLKLMIFHWSRFRSALLIGLLAHSALLGKRKRETKGYDEIFWFIKYSIAMPNSIEQYAMHIVSSTANYSIEKCVRRFYAFRFRWIFELCGFYSRLLKQQILKSKNTINNKCSIKIASKSFFPSKKILWVQTDIVSPIFHWIISPIVILQLSILCGSENCLIRICWSAQSYRD